MKQFFLFTFFLGYSLLTIGQNADEIVTKHIEAIGGLENWRNINTMKMEMSSDMGGMKIPIKSSAINNTAVRVEFVVQGMTGIQVVTEKNGWSLMPFMGQTKPEPTPEEQLKGAKSQLDLQGQFVDYAKKGSTIELLGEDEVEGVEVFKVKLTDKDKTETTYFIDKENFMVIQSSTKVEIQGQEVENITTYGNYKKVEKVTIPHQMTGGGMGTMEITKIELNAEIDKSIFDMPKQ